MTSELLVTTVTKDASVESLTNQDYRDIYEERRGYDQHSGRYAISLDSFIILIGSVYSKAVWSKYHRGVLNLNRTQRNELRASVGLPLLPPTPAEVMREVDPNAAIFRVGDATPNRVLLIGATQDLSVSVERETVRAYPVEATRTPLRKRKTTERPWATRNQIDTKERLGVSWKDVIDAGLQAMIHLQSIDGSEERENKNNE